MKVLIGYIIYLMSKLDQNQERSTFMLKGFHIKPNPISFNFK